jgi:hypothetical protein
LYVFCIPLFGYVLYTLFDVSTTPPGYLKLGNMSKEDFLSDESLRMTNIKGAKIELKYCETCKVTREPRSFHCSFCGFCVIKHGKNKIYLFIKLY